MFDADPGFDKQCHFLKQAGAGDEERLRDIGSEIQLRAGIEEFSRQLLLFCDRRNHLPLQIIAQHAVESAAMLGMPDHVEIERRNL